MSFLSKYKMLAVVVLLATGVSCKKSFLELTPPTAVSPEDALKSEADVLVAVRGIYAGLRTGMSIGTTSYAPDAFGRTIPLLGDLMADNAYQSTSNSGRYTSYNAYNWTVADANALGFWGSLYQVILRANNVLNTNLPQSANMDQYKGEAYAVRALCYFTLVRYFARPYTDDPSKLGVPIVLTYDPNYKPLRNKISEVYTLILSDLNEAFKLMTQYNNSSQFSKYAAKALLAKVYLTMGDMANAKAAALDVITNGGFRSVEAADYAGYWTNASYRIDKVETIFEVSSDAVSNLSFDALPYIYSQGGYGDFLVSDSLYKLFEATDVRKALYPVTPRQGVSIIAVSKYPSISNDRSDTKILRLSEMYLIAAEASVSTDENEARAYVNYITSRRGATAISSTGTALFEDIITERRKELAFEGDRYPDLQRLKREIKRSNNYPSSARSISYGNNRRLLPIPQTEVDANPGLKPQQNDGY
ncbi:MAG TPA: RagB/SusD family nutrient uptake outer membrane protein [Niastella sp.]